MFLVKKWRRLKKLIGKSNFPSLVENESIELI